MDDLLTTRQVQAILKVDRITVYRMLQDGRLKGVKIGQQWRFNRAEVERLLHSAPSVPASERSAPDPGFPTHCVQTIQDLFAEVSQLAALVIDLEGRPLTQFSRPAPLFSLLQQSAAAQAPLRQVWCAFAQTAGAGGRFFTCPVTGLQYTGAVVEDRGQPAALFLAGQFYWQAPNPREEAGRLNRLALTYRLPLEDIQRAAGATPILLPEQHTQVEAWPAAAARAVESILHERTGFVERLQRIAHLTQLS